MLKLEHIIGHATEPGIAEQLHLIAHGDGVEYVALDPHDTARRRIRITTDRGTDCAIAIDRSQRLDNGAVLLLESQRAIVVRVTDQTWLRLEPRDTAAALELGYWIGNLHWRVQFYGARIQIAIEGPVQTYRERLVDYVRDGRARYIDD